jgi:hypothetical protein
MREDPLRYDRMVEQALRGVVRQALRVAADRGLPGAHHFYLTFLTGHPGVEIGEHLRARFPKDMTIVLQHEYWGLEVDEHAFSVTLSFSGQNERLTIPFAAVTGFADPAVKFGLQFEVTEADVAEGAGPVLAKSGAKAGEKTALPVPEGKTGPGKAAGKTKPDEEADPARSADVVTLDAFRKK